MSLNIIGKAEAAPAATEISTGKESKKTGTTQHLWPRYAVQAGFVAWSILIGMEFHRFVLWLDGRLEGGPVVRPAGVEGFLPISSLVSFVQLLKTGIANRVHPAGLVIFVLVLVLAVLMRRGFCSWVCPFGTASEWLWKAGRRIFGRVFLLPRFLDIPLRGLRYLLLGFFVYVIGKMSGEMLAQFVNSPYNRIADVKMYLFFAPPSRTTVWVMGILMALSVVIPNFWCRYLCPYGAFLGIFSAGSPLAVRRDADRCVSCGRCARACPNRIAVDKKQTVHSVECTACYTCVHACKREHALRMGLPGRRRWAVPVVVYGAVLLGAFLLGTHGARAAGYWDSETPPMMYRALYRNAARVEHPRTMSFGEPSSPAGDARRP